MKKKKNINALEWGCLRAAISKELI